MKWLGVYEVRKHCVKKCVATQVKRKARKKAVYMKCPHCGSEWNVSPQMMNNLKNCPFCRKSLTSAGEEKATTLESVLCQIASDYGLESLSNGRQMIGYFTDLAPDLKRECRMLKYFVDAGGHTALFNARNAGPADQHLSMEHAVQKMMNEFLIAEDAARAVCAAYWTATSGVYTHLNITDKNTHGYASDGIVLSQEKMDELFERIYFDYLTACDYEKAIPSLQMLSERGHAEAQFHLATAYDFGFGVNQNHLEAAKWYRRAAEQGDVGAQGYLAELYEKGTGVTKDPVQAVYWYTKAAERSSPVAQMKLGEMYSEGIGVRRDTATAAAWYLKAAREFGRGEKQEEKVAYCYQQAAELGDAVAQRELGFHYYTGKGVTQSYQQAVYWYQKAARNGETHSQYFLALAYYHGDGVQQNREEAYQWFQKAADQGHYGAKLFLNHQYNIEI